MASLQEGWEDFLDWSDERGLPFARASDWLEEKGIPSLPAFIALVLVLGLAVAFVVMPALLGPKTGDVRVTLADENGSPIPGALVRLVSTAGEPSFSPLTQTTDSLGTAVFSDVPAETVHVSAGYEGYLDADQQLDVAAGKTQEVSLSTSPVEERRVSVSAEISGPADAERVSTTLFDDAWNPITLSASGLKPTFNIRANSTFQVRITAPGYSEKTLTGQYVEESDKFLGVLSLAPLPTARKGRVHVTVRDSQKKPLPNATVEVSEASTGKALASATTGEDGAIAPVELAIGTRVTVKAALEDYSPKLSDAVAVTDETIVELELRRLDGPQRLDVELSDADGALPQNAVLRLYLKKPDGSLALLEEQRPFEQRTSFELEQGREYAMAAYARGFLPQFFPKLNSGSRRVTLLPSTPANSARLRLHVTNFDGSDAGGASVALYARDRTPLGMPEKVTGPDGIQYFDDLPLAEVLVAAESNGRTAEARVTLRQANESAELVLSRGTGRLKAIVTDRYSKAPVRSATVMASGVNSTSCTTDSKGECTATLAEYAGASAHVSAPGYEEYSTSSLDIRPNTETKLQVELFPTSVSATTKLEFAGFFDSRGRKVKTLSPASDYSAKFVLRSPPIGYSQARAFVYVGDIAASLENAPAVITSYSAQGALRTHAGTDFELAKTFSAQNATEGAISTAASEAQAANNPSASEFKWAEFVFGKSEQAGGREITVNIRTRAQSDAKTSINYRTAFVAGSEVLRSPPDEDAGVSKSELLANAEGIPIEIGFEGTCQDELCIQVFFEDENGARRGTQGFEAPVGREFALRFKAISSNATMQAALETSGIALGILRGSSGTIEKTPSAGEEGRSAIKMDVDGGEGEFTLRSQRVSSDASLKFTLTKGADQTAFEKTYFVRVVAPSKPVLTVDFAPRSLTALKASSIEFRVKDSLGLPVADARVSVGALENDALGRIEQATELPQTPGTYRLENVAPEKAGDVSYEVEARGFSIARGRIPVSAKELVTVSENSISINVEAKGETKQAPITITNLLENEVAITLSVSKDRIPRLLEISVEPSEQVKIPAKGVLNAALSARIADFVLALAERDAQLGETVKGRVRVSARVGASRQAVEIPFTVTTSIVQRAISGTWAIDKNAVELELAPPNQSESRAELTVTNNAPHPLLINTEVNGRGIFVEPLSAEIAPGESAAFEVVARASTRFARGGECVFDSERRTASAAFFATFQGISSRKPVSVAVNTLAKGTCAPAQPTRLVLPVTMRFEIPAGAKIRKNDDASTTVQLSDGTRMLFSSAASVRDRAFEVPLGTDFTVEQRFVNEKGNGAIDFTLPVQATLIIPQGAPVISRQERNTAVLGGVHASFPSSLALSSGENGRSARLPAGTVLSLEPSARPDLSRHASAKLPVKATFFFPKNSIVTENQDGSFAASQSSGDATGFGPDTQRSALREDGSIDVTAQAGEAILLEPSAYNLLASRGFEVRLPARTELEFPSDTEVVQRGQTVVAFLDDYDLVLPQATVFAQGAGGKTTSLPAGSVASFRAVDGRALTANAFVSLPVALRLVLPADARVDESTVGKVISLANGDAIGLPPDAQISERQLDGTRIATVPPFSQVSLPQSYVNGLPGGGFVLKPSVAYALGLPPETRVLDAASESVFLLPQFDLKLPKNTRLTEAESIAFTQVFAPQTQAKFAPVPEISSKGLGRVTLPADLTAVIPFEARINQRSDGLAVLLREGLVVGFAAPAELSSANASTVSAPAGSAILLPPFLVDASAEPRLKITLPYAATLTFDETVQVLRGTSSTTFAGEDYKLTISSPSARIEQGAAGGARASVPAGTVLELEPAQYSVIGEEFALPAELAIKLPADALVRQKQDGRLYVESKSFRALLGAGAEAKAGVATLPENTPAVFQKGVITPLRSVGLKAAQSFRFTLPVAYSLSIPEGAAAPLGGSKANTQAILYNDYIIEYPASAKIERGESGAIREIILPAGAGVNFLKATPGLSPEEAREIEKLTDNETGGLALKQKLARAAQNNVVIVPPFQLDVSVPPQFNVSGPEETGSGPAIWLSENKAITFGPTAQLSDGVLRTIAAPPGTQLSLPPEFASVSPGGGYHFNLPFATAISVPHETEIFQDRATHVLLEPSRQEINLPLSAAFAETPEFLRGELGPSTRIDVRPIASAQLGDLTPVSLPFDVELILTNGARAFGHGSGTVVRFADGSQAEFPGTYVQGGGTSSFAGAAAEGNAASGSTLNFATAGQVGTQTILWPSGTNALLPKQFVSGNEQGSVRLTLPVQANVILPPDARVAQRNGVVATLPLTRQVVHISSSSRAAAGPRGTAISVPAGSAISTAPFGLDLHGIPITVPFEIQLPLPPNALVDEHGQGGIVVEFDGGARVKFGGGFVGIAAPMGTNLGAGISGFPQGFYSPQAMQPFSGRPLYSMPQGYDGYSYSTPAGFGGYDPYSSYAPGAGGRSNSVTAPAFSQVVLSPNLARPLSYGNSPFGGPSAYEFSLPAPWTAIPQSESAIYNNPDGSLGIFFRDFEIRFPPGTFASPFARFGGGVGAQQLQIPAYAPVRVTPVFNGLMPGEERTLPFELAIQLPQSARVLPRAQDGSRTIDFGGGARLTLNRDVNIDEREYRAGVPLPPQLSEVIVAQGTLLRFSPGMYTPLPPQFAGKNENAALAVAQRGFTLSVPAATRIRIPAGSREARNSDGSLSAFLEQHEIRMPAGTAPGVSEVREGGLRGYAIAPGASVHVIPLVFSDAFERVPISLPFETTLSLPKNARALPKARDESWAIEFPGKGSIAFGPDVQQALERIVIPPEATFYASRELVGIDKSADAAGTRATKFKLTLPGPASIKSDSTAEASGDGRRAILSGAMELVVPASAQTVKQGDRAYVTSVPAGSVIELRPVDSSVGQGMQEIVLPGTAAFSIPTDAKVFPESSDGTRVVKFASGASIVFKGGATVAGDGASRTITASAQTPLAPSASLLRLPQMQVRRGMAKEPSARGWRFATPAQMTLTVPKDAKLQPLAEGYAIQTPDGEEYLLPKNARQAKARDGSTQFSLLSGMVIELRPLEFSTEGLQEVSLPFASTLTIPPGSRELSEPGTQALHYLLPSGERIVFPNGGRKTVKQGSGETVFSLEPGEVFLVPSSWVEAGPDGEYSFTYGSRWSFALNSEPQVQQVGGEYEMRVQDSRSPTGLIAARMPVKPSLSPADVGATQREFRNALSLGLLRPQEAGNFPAKLGAAPAAEPLPRPANIPGSPLIDKRYNVIIPASTRVRFKLEEPTLEDLAGGPVDKVELELEFDGSVEVEASSKVEQKSGTVTATLPQCLGLTIKDAYGNKRMDLPALVQVRVTKATITPRVPGVNTRKISFKKGAKIHARTCSIGADEARTITMRFPNGVTFLLPKDTEPNPLQNTPRVYFPEPSCRQVQAFGGVQVTVPAAEKIDFGAVPPVVPKDNRIAQPDSNPTVYVPPNHDVKFTLCADPTKSAAVKVGALNALIEVQAEDAKAKEGWSDKLVIELDDGAREQKKRVRARDAGAVDVILELDGTKVNGDIERAYGGPGGQDRSQIWWRAREFTDGSGWVWTTGFQKEAREIKMSPTDGFKNLFETVITLPRASEFVNPLTNCVEKEGVIKGTLKFVGREAPNERKPVESNELKVEIVIKKNPGKCEAAKLLEKLTRSGFYATHASEITAGFDKTAYANRRVSFKTPEESHNRYFMLVNNLQAEVSLAAEWKGRKVAECRIVEEGGEKEITGYRMASGSSRLVRCIPIKDAGAPEGGESGVQRLEVKATPKNAPSAQAETSAPEQQPEKQTTIFSPAERATQAASAVIRTEPVETVAAIDFNVFNPARENGVYEFYKESGTPIGLLCPLGENAIDASCGSGLGGTKSSTAPEESAKQPGEKAKIQPAELKCATDANPVPIGTCYIEAFNGRKSNAELSASAHLMCKKASESNRAEFVPGTTRDELARCCGMDPQMADTQNQHCQSHDSGTQPIQLPGAAQGGQQPASGAQKATQAGGEKLEFQSAPAAGAIGGLTPASTEAAPATPTTSSASSTQTKVDSLSASLCEEFFCSHGQVLAAFTSYAEAYREVIEAVRQSAKEGEEIAEHGVLAEFRSRYKLSERTYGWRRSFVLQKAGSDAITPAQAEEAARKAYASSAWKPAIHAEGVTADSAVKECGIYLVETTFRFGTEAFSAQTDVNKVLSESEISLKAKKVADCPENLANAGLLMGLPQKDEATGASNTDIWTGKRIADWPEELGRLSKLLNAGERWKELTEQQGSGVVGTTFAALTFPSVLALGPYGEEYNQKDAVIAKNLYTQIFRQQPIEVQAVKSVSYDDVGYCTANGAKQLLTVGSFVAGQAVATSVAGLLAASTGAGATVGGPMAVAGAVLKSAAEGFGKAAVSCVGFGLPFGIGAGVGKATTPAGGDSFSSATCEGINACIIGAVVQAVTLGGAQKTPAGQTLKEGLLGPAIGKPWIRPQLLVGLGAGLVTGRYAQDGEGSSGAVNALPIFYIGAKSTSVIQQNIVPQASEFVGELAAKGIIDSSSADARKDAEELFNRYSAKIKQRKPPTAQTWEEVVDEFMVENRREPEVHSRYGTLAGNPANQKVLAADVELASKATKLGTGAAIYEAQIENAVRKFARKQLGVKGLRPSPQVQAEIDALAKRVREKVLGGIDAQTALTEAIAEGTLAIDDAALASVLSGAEKTSFENAVNELKTISTQAGTEVARVPGTIDRRYLQSIGTDAAAATTPAEIAELRARALAAQELATDPALVKAGFTLDTYIGWREDTIARANEIIAALTEDERKIIQPSIEELLTASRSGMTAKIAAMRADPTMNPILRRASGLPARGAAVFADAPFDVLLADLAANYRNSELTSFTTLQSELSSLSTISEAIVDSARLRDLTSRIGELTPAEITELETLTTQLRTKGTEGARIADLIEESMRKNSAHQTAKGTAYLKGIMADGTTAAAVAREVDAAASKPPKGFGAFVRDPKALREVFLKRVPVGLLQLAITLLFHIDVAPVNARMLEGTNTLVAANFEYVEGRAGTNYVASMHRYCEASGKECVKPYAVESPRDTALSLTSAPLQANRNDCSPENGFAACAGFRKKERGGYGVFGLVNARKETKDGASQVNQRATRGIDLGTAGNSQAAVPPTSAQANKETAAEADVEPKAAKFFASIFHPDESPVDRNYGGVKLVENIASTPAARAGRS